MSRIIKLFCLFIFCQQTVLAQSSAPEWNILSRVGSGGNSIKLRWMPPTGSSWNSGSTQGYIITKSTYNSSGTSPSTSIVATIPPVQGSDTTNVKWTNYWKSDSTAYKYLFYLTINKLTLNSSNNTPINGVTGLSNIEERFFYANVLADSKFKAAELCGLGFTDTNIIPGTKYSYTIKNIATGEVSPGTGILTATFSPLPDIPINFTKEKRRLKINWGNNTSWDYYSGYFIEKSINGGTTFTRLNDVPYIDMSEDTNLMVYTDSIPNSNATYRYRIVGISYFDELRVGTPKDTTIIKTLENTPGIINAKGLGSNYKVDWVYPSVNLGGIMPSAVADLNSYTLAVSKSDTAKLGQSAIFKVLSSNITKTATTFQISKAAVKTALGDTNSVFYFSLVAYGTNGETIQSLPFAYKPVIIDTIPPMTPTSGLIGTPSLISGTNKLNVKVSWNKVNDNTGGVGVLGYQVFRTIGAVETEKIEVSGGIIHNPDGTTKSFINDTISTSLDYGQLKYYVSAYDSNYNKSTSLLITYTQPDTRRPMPSLISSISVDSTNKVRITFTQSPSKKSEVIIHELLKKELGSTAPWAIIRTISNAETISSYIDASTVGNKTYLYSLVAKDAAGNYSCDSVPQLATTVSPLPSYCYQIVSVKTLNLTTKPALTTLTQTYNEEQKKVTLNWTYAQPNVQGFEIYRGEGASTKKAFLAIVNSPTALSFDDTKVDFNVIYKYAVRAVFNDGSVGAWKEVNTSSLKESSLVVSKESLTFERVLGSQAITISSNITWTITSNATWLTRSVASGSNNATVNISVTANTFSTARSGTITITGSGMTRTIDVLQFAPPTGTGLTAKYYNLTDLNQLQTRTPDISRIETSINLNVTGSPVNGIWDDFVAIWAGSIEVPQNGNYTFFLNADAGAYLYIDNKRIISATNGSFSQEVVSVVQTLQAGVKYPIRLEFWDNSGYAGAKLQWSSNVGLSKQLVSTPYLYPETIPGANDADPFNNKCFVMRVLDSDKVLESPSNFTVNQAPYTGKNEQKWKFEKVGNNYKIISQQDSQNKTLQVIENLSVDYKKLVLGYSGNNATEFWSLNHMGGNDYHIKQNASNNYIGFATTNDPIGRLRSYGTSLRLEYTQCPNYDAGISLDTEELNYSYLNTSKVVSIKSDIEWSTFSNADWVTFNPKNGNQNAVVNVIVGKNTLQETRETIVGIKNNNGSVGIKIRQDAAPCLEVTFPQTGCSAKGLEGVTVQGTPNVGSLYKYMVDNSNVWKDYVWQNNYLSNGEHILYVRKANDPTCTGSVPFSIYCN